MLNPNTTTDTKLTYQDYVCYPNDGKRHEIIDGDHYMSPAPGTYHQTVSRRIQFQLYEQIELKKLGVVFNAPVDLHLDEHNVCQPDIVVLLSENERIITPTKIKGTPNLVVEILSPSTEKNDRELKRSVYQRIGIPEYWIVDPKEHSVEQLRLVDGNYRPQTTTEEISLCILPSVSVNLAEVW